MGLVQVRFPDIGQYLMHLMMSMEELSLIQIDYRLIQTLLHLSFNFPFLIGKSRFVFSLCLIGNCWMSHNCSSFSDETEDYKPSLYEGSFERTPIQVILLLLDPFLPLWMSYVFNEAISCSWTIRTENNVMNSYWNGLM